MVICIMIFEVNQNCDLLECVMMWFIILYPASHSVKAFFFFFRSFSNWYFLQRTLQNLFPQIKIKELPPRQVLWIKSQQLKLEEIARFLQNILSNKNFFHSRIVQLFLQSNLSTEFIQENIDGKRNDEVSTVPRITTLEFKLENDTKVIEKIVKLHLDKVTVNNPQITYHGPTDSNHKSVQNLFSSKRKSLVHHHNHMQSLAEDSNPDLNSSFQKHRNNSGIIYWSL